MPLYEYRCEQCGMFSALVKMSESSLSVVCKSCGGEGKRVLSATQVALLGQGQRRAYERNEKSAYEPKFMRRSGCGCKGGHTCNAEKPKLTTDRIAQSETPANGLLMQTKKTARPWMLGH